MTEADGIRGSCLIGCALLGAGFDALASVISPSYNGQNPELIRSDPNTPLWP